MATLAIQQMTSSGLEATYASAAAGGDKFANNGKTFIHVKNGDGSDKTVTITSQVTEPPAGTAAANIAVTVTAGEERMIGPLNQNGFNDSNGDVNVTYSAVTSVTVAAISL